ncbi:uncharacterized protein [Typha latifolia]|uniref:uncharacterized protein n=1 Tax=Typha latifolia TaxID=4733 RepID=UPI003C2B9B39
MSSSTPTQRSHAPKPSSSNRSQRQRYIPKSNPSISNPRIESKPSPPPSLTTSLRASSTSSSRSKPSQDGARFRFFVSYLPQDEAVASGLGAESGGLDAVESQAVVDLLNDELSNLLSLRPRDFWREVARNHSLNEFLDSYLQFRHRWYDFPHRGARGIVAGVVVGELELCRRVFMVLYRISSNKDPGAASADSLSVKEHTALLQEKKLLDLPKLLDICAIYENDNGELIRSLVLNAVKAQPKLVNDASSAVSHFLNIVHTMHDRCRSSLEVITSSVEHDHHGYGQLHRDFLEVMDFINDAVVTLDAFVAAYKSAALLFSDSFVMSYGIEELLNTLARLHDSLLPSLHRGFAVISHVSDSESQNLSGEMLPDIVLSIKLLSKRVLSFGWQLLDYCYLNDQLTEDSLLLATTKMFPAKVDDPVIRGDILVQTFKDMNKEATYTFQENLDNGTFLQNLEKEFGIMRRIVSLRSNGWIYMDEEQFQYLSQIAAPAPLKSWNKEPVHISSHNNEVQTDEEAAIVESKISQIKDLFPDYGKGFLSACLEVYNQNPEEVIQRILDGTLHEDLLSLDTSLEQIPLPKTAPNNRNDKGKGVLPDYASPSLDVPAKEDLKVQERYENPPSSFVSSSYGRYTRKSNEELPNSAVLDSRTAKDAVRSTVLAVEYEYEDEYDDSFDDLGLSVVESGYEEAENFNDKTSSSAEKFSGSDFDTASSTSNSRWSSQKRPQFYVKDGKNYSYKVSGSVGVSNAQEAAVVNQAQKDLIHGLGRGGNLPLGAVKKLVDAEEQGNQVPNAAETFGRGNSNSRGRGGRRGGGPGGNHFRKDRAMKKHFSGLSGY